MTTNDIKIFLKKEQTGFTMVSNKIITDNRVSSKAKFYYVYLSSKPDNWQFHINAILQEIKESRDAFYSGIKELESIGYLTRQQIKGSDNKFAHTEYCLHICPYIENTNTENPYTENPYTENPHYNNTYSNNTYSNNTYSNKEKINKKENETKQKFIKPTLEEIIIYSQQRNSGVDCKKFFDYYETSNWKDAKGNSVKNWKQKFITWEGRQQNNNTNRSDTICQNNANKVVSYNFDCKNDLDSIIEDNF